MSYLDLERLAAIDAAAFQRRRPYPWVNPAGLLTAEGFAALQRTLPDLALFEPVIGKARKYGQQAHDRYTLEWRPGLALPRPWAEFVEEIRGDAYRAFLRRLLAGAPVALRLHWHYTPTGCSVSPHCDARRKLGSHIFYLNTEADWDPGWGGETLLLDDGGRLHSDSNPRFEDFDRIETPECLGNRSLIFQRQGNSWHGVREIRCPPDRLRKVFIVVFERRSLAGRLRQAFGPG